MQASLRVEETPSRRNVMTSFTTKENAARAGITVAVALFTCLLANGARAEEPQIVKATVSYADLDLSKPAGAQTLYKRIKAAAARVCARNDNYSILEGRRAYHACFDTAVANAVSQIDRPALTALHREETNREVRG
jgi:UrcA family protein